MKSKKYSIFLIQNNTQVVILTFYKEYDQRVYIFLVKITNLFNKLNKTQEIIIIL